MPLHGAFEWNGGLEHRTFLWTGSPGARGARVVKTDGQGVRSIVELATTHLATENVAAGLLGVSVVTVNKWVREGRFGPRQWRNGVSVIPMPAVEALAEQRGIFDR